MIKNFKSELDLVNSNKNISEKLMIFSLYNEFYNDVLGSAGDYFIKKYEPFMKKTFELVVASLNSQENVNVNAEQFMRAYFKMLKKSRLSSMPQVKGIIITFEKELNDFIDASEYANVIEQFESIPLVAKVNIMIHFREYINNMYLTTIELYGEKNSKELRHNILDMLSIRLGEYLKDGLNQGVDSTNLTDNLKPVMMTSTKDYLMNKLKNGEFGFEDIQDEDVKEFFANFNETEQKIWLIGAIYAIAGYDKNDKSKEKEKIEEICKLLGISKFKYTKIAISMGIRFLKVMNKAMNEVDDETFDDYFSKKKKYSKKD